MWLRVSGVHTESRVYPHPFLECCTRLSSDQSTWKISTAIIFFWNLIGEFDIFSAKKIANMGGGGGFLDGRMDVRGLNPTPFQNEFHDFQPCSLLPNDKVRLFMLFEFGRGVGLFLLEGVGLQALF